MPVFCVGVLWKRLWLVPFAHAPSQNTPARAWCSLKTKVQDQRGSSPGGGRGFKMLHLRVQRDLRSVSPQAGTAPGISGPAVRGPAPVPGQVGVGSGLV